MSNAIINNTHIIRNHSIENDKFHCWNEIKKEESSYNYCKYGLSNHCLFLPDHQISYNINKVFIDNVLLKSLSDANILKNCMENELFASSQDNDNSLHTQNQLDTSQQSNFVNNLSTESFQNKSSEDTIDVCQSNSIELIKIQPVSVSQPNHSLNYISPKVSMLFSTEYHSKINSNHQDNSLNYFKSDLNMSNELQNVNESIPSNEIPSYLVQSNMTTNYCNASTANPLSSHYNYVVPHNHHSYPNSNSNNSFETPSISLFKDYHKDGQSLNEAIFLSEPLYEQSMDKHKQLNNTDNFYQQNNFLSTGYFDRTLPYDHSTTLGEGFFNDSIHYGMSEYEPLQNLLRCDWNGLYNLGNTSSCSPSSFIPSTQSTVSVPSSTLSLTPTYYNKSVSPSTSHFFSNTSTSQNQITTMPTDSNVWKVDNFTHSNVISTKSQNTHPNHHFIPIQNGNDYSGPNVSKNSSLLKQEFPNSNNLFYKSKVEELSNESTLKNDFSQDSDLYPMNIMLSSSSPISEETGMKNLLEDQLTGFSIINESDEKICVPKTLDEYIKLFNEQPPKILSLFIGNIPQNVTIEVLHRLLQSKGKILELVTNFKSNSWHTAYVTYSKPSEAIKTIDALNNRRLFKSSLSHRLVCCYAPFPPSSLACFNNLKENGRKKSNKNLNISSSSSSLSSLSPDSHQPLGLFYPKFYHESDITSNFRKPFPENQFSLLRDGPPGANLFIYGIPTDWTEVTLLNLCQEFGHIVGIRIPRPCTSGCKKLNKGFGFVSYDSTESSSKAWKELNGKKFSGKPLIIQLKLGEQLSDILNSNDIKGSPNPTSPESQSSCDYKKNKKGGYRHNAQNFLKKNIEYLTGKDKAHKESNFVSNSGLGVPNNTKPNGSFVHKTASKKSNVGTLNYMNSSFYEPVIRKTNTSQKSSIESPIPSVTLTVSMQSVDSTPVILSSYDNTYDLSYNKLTQNTKDGSSSNEFEFESSFACDKLEYNDHNVSHIQSEALTNELNVKNQMQGTLNYDNQLGSSQLVPIESYHDSAVKSSMTFHIMNRSSSVESMCSNSQYIQEQGHEANGITQNETRHYKKNDNPISPSTNFSQCYMSALSLDDSTTNDDNQILKNDSTSPQNQSNKSNDTHNQKNKDIESNLLEKWFHSDTDIFSYQPNSNQSNILPFDDFSSFIRKDINISKNKMNISMDNKRQVQVDLPYNDDPNHFNFSNSLNDINSKKNKSYDNMECNTGSFFCIPIEHHLKLI